MKNDAFLPHFSSTDDWFESVCSRVLAGEKFDFGDKDLDTFRELSQTFEVLTKRLMAGVPARQYLWYDGLAGLSARPRKARQVEFEGQMWVGDVGNAREQWKEPFRLRVTDKRLTKQGLEIILWMGDERAEAEWSQLFSEP